MSIFDEVERVDWSKKPETEFESAKVGIAKIKSALRIYEDQGDDRLHSVFWRACDGLGDLLTYMIAHGHHDEQTHRTGKGYELSLSDYQYGEAILENKVREQGSKKNVIYSSLQARDE